MFFFPARIVANSFALLHFFWVDKRVILEVFLLSKLPKKCCWMLCLLTYTQNKVDAALNISTSCYKEKYFTYLDCTKEYRELLVSGSGWLASGRKLMPSAYVRNRRRHGTGNRIVNDRSAWGIDEVTQQKELSKFSLILLFIRYHKSWDDCCILNILR